MSELKIDDALKTFEHNPEAAGLAVGMILLQQSRDEVNRINSYIEESDKKRIAELERELEFWEPLGRKWLAFKKLIAPDPEPLC
jgi:hypothetical protein